MGWFGVSLLLGVALTVAPPRGVASQRTTLPPQIRTTLPGGRPTGRFTVPPGGTQPPGRTQPPGGTQPPGRRTTLPPPPPGVPGPPPTAPPPATPPVMLVTLPTEIPPAVTPAPPPAATPAPTPAPTQPETEPPTTEPTDPGEEKTSSGIRDLILIGVFAALGGILLIVIILIIVCCFCRRNRKEETTTDSGNRKGQKTPKRGRVESYTPKALGGGGTSAHNGVSHSAQNGVTTSAQNGISRSSSVEPALPSRKPSQSRLQHVLTLFIGRKKQPQSDVETATTTAATTATAHAAPKDPATEPPKISRFQKLFQKKTKSPEEEDNKNNLRYSKGAIQKNKEEPDPYAEFVNKTTDKDTIKPPKVNPLEALFRNSGRRIKKKSKKNVSFMLPHGTIKEGEYYEINDADVYVTDAADGAVAPPPRESRDSTGYHSIAEIQRIKEERTSNASSDLDSQHEYNRNSITDYDKFAI